MFIHTTEKGETLYSIARKYGVPATMIREVNGLRNPDHLCVGQKLVILTPTRTYTVRGGDTLDQISRRFGVSKRAIMKANPRLAGKDAAYPEEVLALKYDAPTHGCAILNGYLYKGCTGERLALAAVHSEYITVSALRNIGRGLERVIRDNDTISEIKRHGCTPLLRIYDARECDVIMRGGEGYIDELVAEAKKRGYKGITLAAYKAAKNEKFKEFLFSAKRRMIDEELMLLCELDGSEPGEISEVCDACVLMYEKCGMENIPTFDEGERQFYTDFAERCESIKCFMDISPFAYAGNECILKEDANELAYKTQKPIEYDPERMICGFEYTKYGRGERTPVRVTYESPENIKAKLALAAELGFMGMSFDIMRIPTEYLMMISASFACGVNYSFSSFDI